MGIHYGSKDSRPNEYIRENEHTHGRGQIMLKTKLSRRERGKADKMHRILAQTKGEVDKHVDPAFGALHVFGIFHATLAFGLADGLPGMSSGLMLD